jgi:hypothetical protein
MSNGVKMPRNFASSAKFWTILYARRGRLAKSPAHAKQLASAHFTFEPLK